jgi:hypothetical protein
VYTGMCCHAHNQIDDFYTVTRPHYPSSTQSNASCDDIMYVGIAHASSLMIDQEPFIIQHCRDNNVTMSLPHYHQAITITFTQSCTLSECYIYISIAYGTANKVHGKLITETTRGWTTGWRWTVSIKGESFHPWP